MDRTIRVLAIAALVSLGAYAVLMRAVQSALEATGPNTDATLEHMVSFLAQTSSFLAIATGGAMLVVCLQRHQLRWVASLIAALVLAAYLQLVSPSTVPFLFQMPGVGQLYLSLISLDAVTYVTLMDVLPLAFVPLVALLYARPRRGEPTSEADLEFAPLVSPGSETSRQ